MEAIGGLINHHMATPKVGPHPSKRVLRGGGKPFEPGRDRHRPGGVGVDAPAVDPLCGGGGIDAEVQDVGVVLRNGISGQPQLLLLQRRHLIVIIIISRRR